jgi:hypothetical protein
MTQPQPLDLDPILGRLDAATEGPWQRSEDYSDVLTPEGDYIASFWKTADGDLIAHAPQDINAMADEIRRLRADAAAELLPVWEAVYEPGNVSTYLIGYTNDEAPAKAAAEAWLRSQAEVTGRLEWEPWGTATAMPDGYDAWFELIEHHDDGIPTGPGLIVRHRAAAEETHVVADDSDDPEHVDDCPGCEAFTLTGHRAARP